MARDSHPRDWEHAVEHSSQTSLPSALRIQPLLRRGPYAHCCSFYRWIGGLKDPIPDAVKEEQTLTLADIAEPKFLPVSVTASPIEIELPNGGLVRHPVGIGQAVIVDVIQAVTGLQTRRKPLS